MTETEIWTKWESQVVNGIFPLRRFLGRSNHSVVFLTECRAQSLQNAAIKIIPEDPELAQIQIARWSAAAELSHPHLMKVLDAGRCKLGGHPFLFIVTEYAEQNLAQILPHRGLTSEEAREMLGPTLEALAFLHGRNLVHGQLKPTNLLVVDDRLKLSCDSIRPSGESPASVAKPSPYDAPEAKNGAIGSAGDIWSLGATLMEALTQIPPGPHDGSEPRLPSSLPRAFADLVRRSLSNSPASRPTVSALQSQANDAAQPAAKIPAPLAAPQPVEISELPRRAARKPVPPTWLIPAAIGFAAVMVLMFTIRALHRSPEPQSATANQPAASQPPSTAAPRAPAAPAPTASIVHEEIPVMSRSARDSIHGQIKVAVRVNVDRAGSVSGENIEVHGASKYFARLASDAAKKWKFAPADNSGPREWLIQFEFSREGASAHAVRAKTSI
jgi:serine/threonine protein kinase